jgi:hypothetical protein
VEIQRVGRPLPEGMVLAPLRLRARPVLVVYAGFGVIGLLSYVMYKRRVRLLPLVQPLRRRTESITTALEPLSTALEPLDRVFERWNEAEVLGQPVRNLPLERIAVAAVTLPLALKNREDAGHKVRGVRVRRVDLRTGGPITLRSALIHYGASAAIDEVTDRVKGEIMSRRGAKIRALYPELDLLRPQYEGDPAGLQRAWKALLREHGLTVFDGVLLVHSVRIAFRLLPVLLTPLHQSLPDLLAGIVTIVDEPGRPNRPS